MIKTINKTHIKNKNVNKSPTIREQIYENSEINRHLEDQLYGEVAIKDFCFYKIYEVLSISKDSHDKFLNAIYEINRPFVVHHIKKIKSMASKHIGNENIAHSCYIGHVTQYLLNTLHQDYLFIPEKYKHIFSNKKVK